MSLRGNLSKPLSTKGVIRLVTMQMQGYKFQHDYRLLTVAGYDLVLGVDWLETLRLVGWNFQHKTMEFTVDGVNHRIVGATGSLQSTTQVCHIMASIQDGWHSKNNSESAPLPKPLQRLINTYVELFTDSTSLPPTRNVDHKITLMAGTTPVLVRPYWYAHSQI